MSEYKPFISIVIPVYNAEEYLYDTLKSIRAQLYSNYEVIMVDDCSTDRSLQIGREWENNDERFKIIHLQENGGAANARNKGMSFAQGRYLAFMDADDTITEDILAKAVNSIDGNLVDQVIWGLTENYYNEDGILVEQNLLYLDAQTCKNIDEVKDIVIKLEQKTLFGYQWNRLYKLSIIKEHNIQFENVPLYEDYFFNLEIIKHVKTINIISSTGYYYNKRMNESLTSQFVKDYFRLSHRRVGSMLQLYQEWDACDQRVRDTLGNIYLRYILSGMMRNCDKRSGFSFGRRRNWVMKVWNHSLYKEVAAKGNIDSGLLRVLRKLMNWHWALGCLWMGRLTYVIKEMLPMFFALKKKK